MTYMLGRLPRSRYPEVPHMSALFAGCARIKLPNEINYSDKMPDDLGMMLNNSLGDCTKAGWYHAEQVWTFNASGAMRTANNATVLKSYELIDGYVDGDPSTDNGGNEQNDLGYAVRTGMPQDDGSVNKLMAFVEVDQRITADVRQAIYECGLVYIGFNVPAFLIPQDGSPVPDVWDLQPGADNSIIGGHCVVQPGYDSGGLTTISWGSRHYRMTWEFFDTFVEEVYALVDADWVKATGLTLGGLSLSELDQQMESIRAA